MIHRLLKRLLYRGPAGGKIHTYMPSSGSVPMRLTRGAAFIDRAIWDYYGEEYFAALMPDTDFVIVD